MSMRAFLSIERKLAASVAGCPRPTIEQHVRDAAIEVCNKTKVWRYEQDSIRLSAGEYNYDFDTPDFTEVAAIISATMNGTPLSHITEDELHDAMPSWPQTAATDWATPTVISQVAVDQFVVAAVPDATQTYDVKMFLALKPTVDATGMDSAVFDRVEQIIIHGALQHLLVLPEKPWSDRELATYHAKQYTYKTASFRADANLGATRSSLSVKMRPFV
jgi:hypothetical protein